MKDCLDLCREEIYKVLEKYGCMLEVTGESPDVSICVKTIALNVNDIVASTDLYP